MVASGTQISYYNSLPAGVDEELFIIEVECTTAGTTGVGDYTLTGDYVAQIDGDLSMYDIFAVYPYPYQDEFCQVYMEYKNNGPYDITEPFYIDLYYNESSPPYQGKPSNQNFYHTSWLSVGGIAWNLFSYLSYDPLLPKIWRFYAYLDGHNDLNEPDETNNCNAPPIFSEPVIITWREREITFNYNWPLKDINGNFTTPQQINSVLNEPRDTSASAYYHDGIDIQANVNTEIYSVSSGWIEVTSSEGAYVGDYFYYHLKDIGLEDGEWLDSKELVAVTNNLNHLHFNDGENHEEINPLLVGRINPQAQTGVPYVFDWWFIADEDPNTVLNRDQLNVNFDIIVKTSGFQNRRCGIYRIGYRIGSEDIVWTFTANDWINHTNNPRPFVYMYYPPDSDSHIYRVTNFPDQNGYCTPAQANQDIRVYIEDTYGHQIMLASPNYNSINGNNITSIPKDFSIIGNYPNPFNSQTNIKFQVPSKAQVTVVIYNTLGQKIKTLFNQVLDPGYYATAWDGTNNNNQSVGSSVYIVEMLSKELSGKFTRNVYKINLIK